MKKYPFFKKIFIWIAGLFHSKSITYKTVKLEELPDDIDKQSIYILGEGPYLWSVALKCPCGCQEILQMSLHKEGRPRWEIFHHEDGTVSLTPSVWRQVGCRSHFFFKRGQIKWIVD